MRSLKKTAALGALTMSLLVGGGSALAEAPPGAGESGNAPGQVYASENCSEALTAQHERDVTAGGGPKSVTSDETGAAVPAPANCDHFFQEIGVIG